MTRRETLEITYEIASHEKLEWIGEKNIAAHPEDERWVRWMREALEENACGRRKTFLVCVDGEPVGEGTLLFDPACKAVHGITAIADGAAITNINALRIEKRLEGQGHISKLVHMMEEYAKKKGYRSITIGVEACETRNLAIYLHWGYRRLVHWELDEGELILYYEKEL